MIEVWTMVGGATVEERKMLTQSNLSLSLIFLEICRNSTLSPVEVGNHFADIRFVRLSAIKNIGDSLSGCWATIGVLLVCTSSSGKPYIICKIGSSCQRKPMQQGEHISIEGLMKALRSETSAIKIGSKRPTVLNKKPESKREKTCNPLEKTIDLEIVSSDFR
ncbi:protein MCM10 [Carex littledalei]|uniref:Protein MCM10 n=1 Tax=Carex littledalei TaxID=544730 RepID=A0A833VZ77_9POAL|nr:protein MCM10 [Carex littledalei]